MLFQRLSFLETPHLCRFGFVNKEVYTQALAKHLQICIPVNISNYNLRLNFKKKQLFECMRNLQVLCKVLLKFGSLSVSNYQLF